MEFRIRTFNEEVKQSMDISQHVWQTKYRYASQSMAECSITDTWCRVARALATIEPIDAQGWESRFYRILQDFMFVPGGRILAGAGTAMT